MANIHTAVTLSGSSSSHQQPQVPAKYHQQPQTPAEYQHQPVKYEASDQSRGDIFQQYPLSLTQQHQPHFPLKFEADSELTKNQQLATEKSANNMQNLQSNSIMDDKDGSIIDAHETKAVIGDGSINVDEPVVVISDKPGDGFKNEDTKSDEKSSIVTVAGKVLNTAANSIAKCEEMLSDANDDFCDKTLVTVICKLKAIKNDISLVFGDLAKIEPNVLNTASKSVKNEGELMNIDDYLIKTELEEVGEHSFMNDYTNENDDDNDYSNQGDNDSNSIKMENNGSSSQGADDNPIDLLCENCDEYFTTLREFKKHKRLCASEGTQECDICDKSFASSKSLTRHIVKRHPNVFYKCNVCDEEFKNKSDLTDHRARENHVSDKKKWHCEFCSKQLTSKDSYTYHISKFHSMNHTCQFCQLAFDDSKALKDHLKSEHNTSKYNCTTCSKAFDTIPNLQKHMAEHGVWNCSHCNKEFMNEKALKGHVKNQHSQRYDCRDKECKEVFDSKWDMKRHYANTHAPPKKKICPTCGYTTNRATSLWRHVQSHGDPLHKCDVCAKPFHTKSQLQAHVRIHTGEKPYLCKECGSTFRTSSQLACHRFVHNGEKPYVCFLCHKAYSQRGNLKTHMKSHSGVGIS